DSELLVEAATKPEVRAKELARIRSSLAEAMAEIRSICSGLVLPQIEKASVSEIVERVVEAHQYKSGTQVETTVDEDGPEPAPGVKICVYRFVQEALNNAYRHGGGIQQTVKATSRGGYVRVEVSDRGEGFDPREIRPANLGLAGLRE